MVKFDGPISNRTRFQKPPQPSGCDIFVLLFFTKVERYTAEEFEAAFGAFRAGTDL